MVDNGQSADHSGFSAAALIVAAGVGARLDSGPPKQYLPLFGKAVLRHAVEAFGGHPRIGRVQLVIGAGQESDYGNAVEGMDLPAPVTGGANRQASVLAGLRALAYQAPDFVLIHDAARPFVSRRIIDATLAAAIEFGAAVPALALSDSLTRGRDGLIAEHLDRTELFRVQTPQVFRFREILAAHESCTGGEYGDDAAVARAAGLAVKLVVGAEENFKITRAQDLVRAEQLLLARHADLRIGQGFDVHRFGPGDGVWLCGVKVPHDRSLQGHSDADVALHALTDAVLGAAALGDIGQHFPPDDARWKDQASALFLRHALDLAAGAGGIPVHVDLTLICQAPKIGPHREAMRASLAAIMGLPLDRVSVKATTTEGLGFTGRGEGIAAQAIAGLRFRGGGYD